MAKAAKKDVPNASTQNETEAYKVAKKALSLKNGCTVDVLADKLDRTPRQARLVIDRLRRKGQNVQRVAKNTFKLNAGKFNPDKSKLEETAA
jgi:hypothetical protein